MKKRRWSDGWALAVLLLSLRCPAQDSFHYRVQVDTPARSDFYRIALSPEIIARSNTDLSDLRILGADGRFVPYVIKERPTDSTADAFQEIPDPVLLQKDSSDRHSYITLTWPRRYRIDRLSLAVGYPTLFKRGTTVLGETPNDSWFTVLTASMDSKHTEMYLQGVRTRRLQIVIDNADNAPLRINAVSAKQTGISLLTYLQAGTPYTLLTEDPKAATPRYDLGYFTDTLTRQPRDIGVGPGHETVVVAGGPDTQVANTKDKPGEQNGLMLWSILSTVLLLLIYFSVKMVSAIGTKKTPNDRV